MSRVSAHPGKERDNHRNNTETLEQESEHSDAEEEYTYCLRNIPVYNRRVRSSIPQSNPQNELSAIAPEFQPTTNETEPIQSQQTHEPDPIAVPDPVQTPLPAAVPPAEETSGEFGAHVTMEDTGSQEPVDNSEPVTEPPEEEAQPVRRSARAQKPREMLTYDHLGHPSYQSWRPGANLMFAYAHYPMSPAPLSFTPRPVPSFYPAAPEHCYYPPQAVWTY